MGRYKQWFDNLPPHTQAWLQAQPIWHDRDLVAAAIAGAILGLGLGLLF